MAYLKVITAPDPILRKKAEPIKQVDDTLRSFMDDMLETMYEGSGVGLAAPQVGVSKRIITMDLQSDDDQPREKGFYPLVIANPEIIKMSDEMNSAQEACLSVPEQRIEVVRHKSVTIEYLDYNNEKQTLDADGWLARVIQHEIDHLDGKLMIDYLSNLKKSVVIRRLKKIQKWQKEHDKRKNVA